MDRTTTWMLRIVLAIVIAGFLLPALVCGGGAGLSCLGAGLAEDFAEEEG